MSVQALSCALALRGVTPSEKLLLLVLANYADEKMRSFPSHSRLAGDTGLSERTILSLMKALEAKRIVSRHVRKRADGSRSSDVITLHFSGEVVSPGGEIISPGVGKSSRGGGEMVSPLTTFEPTIEPSKVTTPKASAPDPDLFAKQFAEATEAAGDALASLAVAPGISSIAPLRALLSGEKPCDWREDVLPAIGSAAAWHRQRDGPGSMRSWTTATKIAVQNRDARLAGPPNPNVVPLDVKRPRTAASPRDDRLDRMLRGAVASLDG